MRIAIVGAGIAGLTSALAFSGRGHEITLLERRTGFGETGAGIQLSPNATGILLSLGLGPALRRCACEPDGMTIRALRDGRRIGGVAFGPSMRDRFGAPYLALSRSDLHTILLDAVRARPDILIRVGRGANAVSERDGVAQIEGESAGGQQGSVVADLVIGADGVVSRMRASLGEDVPPAYSGFAAYRAVLPAEARPAGFGPDETGLWLGPGAHVVHYPVAAGRQLNLVVVASRPKPSEGWSREASPDEVMAALARAHPDLRALAGRAEAWSAWSLFTHTARRLGRGRVALVGDAAHPVLPFLAQGGGLAIEDAAHLAALVGSDPAAVPDAVAAYARARLPRVRRVQQAARSNGRVYHASGLVALGRNLVMRRLGPEGMRERYAWLYGWTPPAPKA
ncbi:FAD-dependent oxidoreductase [Enterovirga rhinocerotis]|uniref:Salicylate hydroxylase n=1 Tax=Enterovirga rhinocerotis TaxID=1339210 RepID=A0A4V3DYL3_9HYPH|nr:FAD-dependent oxidoreductase [Enterovirga rhinocerotis]TDR93089.1 salicylate hydroxylase [Enterovirga rhinocerotis]